MDASGWNQTGSAKDPHSISLSPKQTTHPEKGAFILLAEDNPGDVLLVREALRENNVRCELLVLTDGSDAIRFIESMETGETRSPDIVLLDLNLPKYSGHTLLEQFRRSERSAEVPIVVITSSDSPEDRELTRILGATRYFRKPSDYDQFILLGGIVQQLLDSPASSITGGPG